MWQNIVAVYWRFFARMEPDLSGNFSYTGKLQFCSYLGWKAFKFVPRKVRAIFKGEMMARIHWFDNLLFQNHRATSTKLGKNNCLVTGIQDGLKHFDSYVDGIRLCPNMFTSRKFFYNEVIPWNFCFLIPLHSVLSCRILPVNRPVM